MNTGRLPPLLLSLRDIVIRVLKIKILQSGITGGSGHDEHHEKEKG